MKNPKWHRDEIILALDLYFDPNRGSLDKKNPKIIELSKILNQLPLFANKPDEQRFRNPNGVTLKLCNFLPFDEGYKGKGMTRNSKLDKEIFYEYASIEKRTDLKVIAANIKASIDIKIVTATSLLQEDDPIAYEGSISYRWHKVIERNPAIVEKKKRSILNAHGKLACEICDFDFERVYGELGKGFIECHHKIPLSQIDHETPTLLSDLSLVCANCHRIIHRNIETHSFEQIKKQIRDRILNS